MKTRIHAFVGALLGAMLLGVGALAQDTATFAGMTCTRLTDAQLADVEGLLGEECGVHVASVLGTSLSADSGVKAGDILISVRLQSEDEYYGIPPGLDDMAEFCRTTEASDTMRLLVLRKENDEWGLLECQLGSPLQAVTGGADAETPDADDKPQAAARAVDTGSYSFSSGDPEKVLAKALDGSPLMQKDVDIYGGLLAWAFDTRLTEAQKLVVRDELKAFWPQAPGEVVRMFNQGVRSVPNVLPSLTAEQRQGMRGQYGGTFLTMAGSMPDHPLSRVILAVSGNLRQVLAGAGSDMELTQQDVDALLEYLAFQSQVQTGQPVVVTPEQRSAFTAQVVARYKVAPETEKRTLARMDETWGVLRAQWAVAHAAQQQALAQQWKQAYAQQQTATGASASVSNWQTEPGGGMSQGSFDAVMNAMNATHEASMSTLGAIDGGYDTSVYDSAGNWLYDY